MLLVSMMLSVVAFAQDITGQVKDQNGEDIIGASVQVKGTQIGAVTDFDGKFTVKGAKAGQTLVVSYVGFQNTEVKIGSQTNYNIVLKEDNLALEELVVVGYGVMKKKDLTGAVASVKTEDLGKVASANALQAMQAKVPGVDLQQSDGQAGSGVSINLRGTRSIKASNSPLILVDGVEYGSTLDIPASEIESMDILKDAASTAIYGTKGANGVIIITTKRGKAGRTNVSFNGYVSFKSPANVIKPMTGAKEVQRLIDAKNYQQTKASGNWDSFVNTNTAESVLGTAAWGDFKLIDIVNEGSYTDWLDHVMENGTTQNYEVNVNGGSEKTQFSVALSMMNDRGMMKNDKFDRYTGRANIDHEINKYVKIGTSLSYAYKSNDKRADGVYNLALKMTSITHPYNNDGSILTQPSYFYQSHYNPLLDEVDGAYQRNIETTRFFGSAYVQVTPMKGLTLKSNFTLDRSNARDGSYTDMDGVANSQGDHKSHISNASSIGTKYVWQNTANYNFGIGENHDFTILLGHEMTQSVNEDSSISGVAGAEHYYQSSFYDVSKITDATVTSAYVKKSMVSYFARLNYSLMDRYLFQASVRADGASQLAKGHQWGYFPSASAGWRISEEKFMESTKTWLDNLKLRASWGLSGNAAINPYQTLATVSPIVPNSTNKAPMTLANTDLTWEKTSAFDLGLDVSVFGGRLSGSFDYYNTRTYDLLYYKTAPASSIYTSSMANVGKTAGHGFEVAINAIPVQTKDFTWDINASATMSRDEVRELADGLEEVITPGSSDASTILKIGEPVNAYYDYEIDGCWGVGEFAKYTKAFKDQTGIDFEKPYADYGDPGTTKVIDRNNDGAITDADKMIYNRSPKTILGMTNTFTYKGWSLSVQMMARLGGYMSYRGYRLYTYDNSNWGDLDYWTPENTGAVIPSPGLEGGSRSAYMTAIQLQKADYFKVKDITLTYNFDKPLLKKTGFINSARIYCSLKNFITTGKISGYDSERGGSVTFPLAKQVVVGLNVTF